MINQNDLAQIDNNRRVAESKKSEMIKVGTWDLKKPECKEIENTIDMVNNFYQYLD